MIRPLFFLFFGFALLASSATAGEEEAVKAWEQASRSLFNDAESAFARLASSGGDAGRLAFLGRAAALLNRQPRSTANVEEARRLLASLRRPGDSDEMSQAAAYLLARIDQLHGAEPDLAKATAAYSALADRHPGTFYGQLALLKYATLSLLRAEPPEVPVLLLALEERSEELTVPEIRRNFHRVLAETAADAGAMADYCRRHFRAAAEIGFDNFEARSDAWLRAAHFARLSGHPPEAIHAYRRFLEQNPRDARSAWARDRLAELEAVPASP